MQLKLFKFCKECKSEKQPKDFYSKSSKCLLCEDNLFNRRMGYKTNEFWLKLLISHYQNIETKQREKDRTRGRRDAKKPINRLKRSVRKRISHLLRMKNIKKDWSISKSVGCSVKDLRIHFEKQFQPGMTWDNYGLGKDKWNVDHIKPVSKFNLNDKNDIQKCNHYTNLQPMWHEDNMIKGDKYGTN